MICQHICFAIASLSFLFASCAMMKSTSAVNGCRIHLTFTSSPYPWPQSERSAPSVIIKRQYINDTLLVDSIHYKSFEAPDTAKPEIKRIADKVTIDSFMIQDHNWYHIYKGRRLLLFSIDSFYAQKSTYFTNSYLDDIPDNHVYLKLEPRDTTTWGGLKVYHFELTFYENNWEAYSFHAYFHPVLGIVKKYDAYRSTELYDISTAACNGTNKALKDSIDRINMKFKNVHW